MTNIGAANYGDFIRQTLNTEYNKKKQKNTEICSAASAADTTFDSAMSETSSTNSAQSLATDKISAPTRWTDSSLYKIDHNALEGYTVNKAALSKVREQLSADGIHADSRTPTHEITDEQMEWLSSRYDFGFLSACSFTHEDFGNFMLDLAYLNVFSLDEVENMYGVMPFNSNHGGYLYKMNTGDNSYGYVDTFSGSTKLTDDEDLLAELMMEYLKAKKTGLSKKEYERMSEQLIAQRQERLTVLEHFFERISAVTSDYSTNNIRQDVKNISEQLKEDFGGIL